MIVAINRDTLSQIKNPTFAAYASIYVTIYEGFMRQIEQFGLDVEPVSDRPQVLALLETLRQKGARFRNDGKSIYLNQLSPACVACQTGVGSATFFISLQCHRDCFYCFNPNQENYEYFRRNQRNLIGELQQIQAAGQQIKHLALTGGEPLLHKREAVEFFRYADERFPAAYKRLYTTGDHANVETLKELESAGLDEIRFSIRMHDLEKGHRYIFDRVALARSYIPHVMIEMPVLPGTFDEMKEVLLRLDELKLDSINLLEFCFPLTNARAFKERGYRIRQAPFRVLYDYWYAGGLPVAGSELECLRLIELALDQQMAMGVHYCSLENKLTGQIYQQNFNQPRPRTAHFSSRDYFLKSAKVFGPDISKALSIFKQIGYTDYAANEQHDYVEFHVNRIKELKDLEIEIGIASSVFERRADGQYLRELQVDLAHPQSFDLAEDV
jgi:pyruvate formate-lyase activating enzyme-like uncharacterized protein